MRLKKITLILVLSLFFACSKDEDTVENNQQLTNVEFKNFNKFDQIGDLILELGENQSFSERSSSTSNSFLPSCATVTTTYTNDSWIREIDFGPDGCQYFNGPVLKGKVIYSGYINSDEHEYTINYTFDNFYYDDIKVDGEKSYEKFHDSSTLENEVHPIYTMNLDFTLTKDSDVYTRVGTKTKEFVSGFDSFFNIFDNKFLTTGNWTTTFNGDIVQDAEILEPLEKRSICPFIRSGVLEVEYSGDIYNINYGNGSCDNEAELSINGGTPIIIHF